MSLFPHCELSHFSPSVYRQWVPLVSATPLTDLYRWVWNFTYVFFMVWGCACDLGIIVRNFLSLFPHCELKHLSLFCAFWALSFSDLRCIDSGYLVIATFHTILNRSFWNFAHVFSCVYRSARGLDMIFKFIFVTFSTLTLSFSEPQIIWKCTDFGYFLSPISHASYEKIHMLSMKFLYSSYNPCL